MPLSPFQQFGIAAGGLAEGFESGMGMVDRLLARRESQRQHQESLRTKQTDEALKLIGAAEKMGETNPGLAQALLQRAGEMDPRFRGLPTQQADPTAAIRRQMQAYEALTGQKPTQDIVNQMMGLKTGHEMTMLDIPGLGQYPVERGKEATTLANVMAKLAYMKKLASGGGGGGRGGGAKERRTDIVAWYNDKDELIEQSHYKRPPKGARYWLPVPEKGEGGPSPLTLGDAASASNLMARTNDPLVSSDERMLTAQMLKDMGFDATISKEGKFTWVKKPTTRPTKTRKGRKLEEHAVADEPEAGYAASPIIEAPPPDME